MKTEKCDDLAWLRGDAPGPGLGGVSDGVWEGHKHDCFRSGGGGSWKCYFCSGTNSIPTNKNLQLPKTIKYHIYFGDSTALLTI